MQKEFYNENGYIVIRKLVSEELLDKCRARFLDICEGKVDSNFLPKFKQPELKNPNATGEYLINKIQDFLYDDVLSQYCLDKSILEIVNQIIGPNITGVHSMLINKPPDASYDASRHPIHQDIHYFPFRPADKIVAAWTAMESIDEQNGCLFVLPGTHKGPLHPHTYETVKGTMFYGITGFDDVPKKKLIMEKGDTVFFHSLLLHGSLPNNSKGCRKAISCHYAASDCYFVNVRGTSQDRVVKDIEFLLQKKKVPLSFEQLWKYRSRLIQGKPGTFQNLSSNL